MSTYQKYKTLSMLLAGGEWKKADIETMQIILSTSKKGKSGWLTDDDIKHLPCSVLISIDDLWTTASNNLFGFTSQLNLSHSIDGQSINFNDNFFRNFGDLVGWRLNEEWILSYNDLRFSLDAPEGHLPSLRFPGTEDGFNWLRGWRNSLKGFLARFESCLSITEKEKESHTISSYIENEKVEINYEKSIDVSSIFLSHSHSDKLFVRRLAHDLRSFGIHVWLDEAELMIGDSLIEEISKAIDSMEYLGVILSSNSVNSRWVKEEVERAMNQQINGKQIKVLPILLEDCELPWFLEGKLYADFRSPTQYNNALKQILRRLGG